ncbi:MAG: hypothetical protein ACJ705_05905 [Nitrososphaeraceae archaeon]
MIIIKQFANNCPGFDVQFRPFFGKEEEGDQILLIKRDVRFNMKSQSTTQNKYVFFDNICEFSLCFCVFASYKDLCIRV